ncbi:MAG: hypothetical protein RL161_327 [Bacteroidota bacterium]
MMLKPATLKFLKDIKRNNNKEWFHSHKDQYQPARENFLEFITKVLDRLKEYDPTIASVEPARCLFRINRDIRFSKNKSPYKTNFGANPSKGGRKIYRAGYYFHLEPGMSFLAGGIWMPEAEDLGKIRQEIDYCFNEFKAILQDRKFRKQFGTLDREAELTRPPKGYDATNPAIDFLKLKSFTVTAEVPDSLLSSPKLVVTTLDHFKTMIPLIHFLNRALDGDGAS